jgi:hypothetical protein
MDAFWDNVTDLGWWHNVNPAYTVFGFGGSNPVNLALSTLLVLAVATCVMGFMQRLRLSVYLGVHMVVALGFMFAIGALGDAYLSPIGVEPNIASAVVAILAGLVSLVNIVGAFGTFRWLEAKFVHDQKIPPQSRPSIWIFRASSYLFVASAFLAMATGAAGISTYPWLQWTFLNVDYNAWLALFAFACTTILSSYFAFRRHHAVDRKRPLDGATTDTKFEYIGDDRRAINSNLGGVGYDPSQISDRPKAINVLYPRDLGKAGFSDRSGTPGNQHDDHGPR